jgi:hypothetical protein
VPFIRHSRDKRGFESTYVMHAYRTAPGGPSRTRVLYLFRSPPHVRVGRHPLDAEVMEALEHTHPDLTFDWSALQRESVTMRSEPREISRERRRDQRPSRPAPPPRPVPARVPAPVPVPVDDGSLLAATLGAAEAARLRQRFDAVIQRITRRARTPEERDQLLDQARRLNPGEWADEAAVRDAAARVEGEWHALLNQLPSRRRGRRAGRRRPGEAIMGADASASAGSSGSDDAEVDGSTHAPGDSDGGGGLGAADGAAAAPDDLPDDN